MGQAPPPQAADGFAKTAVPALRKHCSPCHFGDKKSGGVSLADWTSAAEVAARPELATRVLRALETEHMPPAGAEQLNPSTRKNLIREIQEASRPDCDLAEPGRVTMRRLNRIEYSNTIRDLFGFEFDAEGRFPADDVGNGFDNIGDVLSLSPLHLEQYLAAAEEIARRAIYVPQIARIQIEASEMRPEGGISNQDEGSMFYANGFLRKDLTLAAGRYRVAIRASGMQAGPELPRMAVLLDGKVLQAIDIGAVRTKPSVYELPLEITTGGNHTLAVAFVNDYYQPNDPDPNQRDRNLLVYNVVLTGPLDPPAKLPASHQRILFARPNGTNQDAVAQQVLGAFALRAYRRPPTDAEVSRLVQIAQLAYRNGESFERGIQLGVTACLVSPHFLFRVELNGAQNGRPLNDFEVATRLSYFLWSSCPDDELLRLAGQGQLHAPEDLRKQIARMLADPRASALAKNFGGQWLQLRSLDIVQPNQSVFPAISPELKTAMREETELTFNYILQQNRPLTEFIDAPYTFLNEPLAKLYGIGGVTGPAMRKVALTDRKRGGILTQASVLTVTSNPTRTSPVKRGKFILENILNTPPPPPPPLISALSEAKEDFKGLTMRQRMEQHRKDPACNGCHLQMDPLGLSLENFNGIGGWRTMDDGGVPVDTSGTMPTGEQISGVISLKDLLIKRKTQFVDCLADRLLTYATGRAMGPDDRCHVETVTKATLAAGGRFQDLLGAVILSRPFLTQGRARALKPKP